MTGHPGVAAIGSWPRAGTSWHSRRSAWPALRAAGPRQRALRGSWSMACTSPLLRPGSTRRDIRHHHALHAALRTARRHGEADAGPAAGAGARAVLVGHEDGLIYDFVLRKDARFHNGEAVTAEDVKFSFERYRGAAHALLKERVAGVDTPDPQHIRFRLKDAVARLPHILCRSVRAPGGSCRRSILEKVGDDGFKKAPIGAGPYKFVSFTPGVELVLEAFDQYWRKAPSVKRLVMRVIPDEATRLAALKRGEVDIAYSIRAELAEELQRTPGLTLKPTVIQSPFWLYFADQWDPKSPWHDQRVRQAANLAIDRKTIDQALTLGYSPITGSIIPESFEYYWKPPEPVYDPEKARQLLAEAGHPNGFDAGVLYLRHLVRKSRRGGAGQSGRGGHPRQTSAARAGGILQGLRRQEASRTSSRGRAAHSGMPQRGCRNSRSRVAHTPMAAIPTSMRSTRRRLPKAIPGSVRQSWSRCNRSSTRGRSSRPSGNWPSSTAWAAGG